MAAWWVDYPLRLAIVTVLDVRIISVYWKLRR
jgi:hypothetical protein